VLLGVSLFGLKTGLADPANLQEQWVKQSNHHEMIRTLSIFFSSVLGTALVAIMVAEWRILKGWEPAGLRKMYTGVEVLSIYRDADDPEGQRRIEVQLASGHQEWFLLDPDEHHLCDVEDIVHLSAIGKHVANIVVASGNADVWRTSKSPYHARPQSWRTVSERPQIWPIRVLMGLAPIIPGPFIAKGMEVLIFNEFAGSGRRGRVYNTFGTEATLFGAFFLFFGIVLLVFLARMWFKGWEDEEVVEALANGATTNDLIRLF
jgi:hypothetical protein